MNLQLVLAIIAITLALVFYTIGVFSERKAKLLEKKHVYLFLIGLIFDGTGTTIMNRIASKSATTSGFSIHEVTGAIALLLMLAHLLWAVFVLWKGNDKAKENFHKFSIVVWLFWLIPYIAGIFIGMSN